MANDNRKTYPSGRTAQGKESAREGKWPQNSSGRNRAGERRRKRKIVLLAVAMLLAMVVAAVLLVLMRGQLDLENYSLDHVDLIQKYSQEYQLDPYLVTAVIYVESSWSTEAVSHKGALGLMQLMPDTAEWIAGKLGEEYDQDLVCEPDTNIRYGCWYLRFLLDRFPETATALAAYNAGRNRVSSWLEDSRYSSDGELLTDIPYPETDQYVEKVQRAYEKYKELYPDAFDSEEQG